MFDKLFRFELQIIIMLESDCDYSLYNDKDEDEGSKPNHDPYESVKSILHRNHVFNFLKLFKLALGIKFK